jgi:hypothetical protein
VAAGSPTGDGSHWVGPLQAAEQKYNSTGSTY